MDIISEITQKINLLFEESRLSELAKDCGFIKRERKISAKDFLISLIINEVADKPLTSLSDIASELLSENGVTKQAVQKKCNEFGVEFMKTVLDNTLSKMRQNIGSEMLESLSFVTSITALDSSEIPLSKSLKGVFGLIRGDLGVIKLQTQLDLLASRVEKFELCNVNEPDQGYRGHLSNIVKGGLVISDLGYFRIKSFAELEANGSYFLSRYFKRTNLYRAEGMVKIDLHELLSKEIQDVVEMDIMLGTEKFGCRLVALKLSASAYAKRLTNLEKSMKKDKRLKSEISVLDKWTIFVTNLPKTLTGAVFLPLYSLRWQIELFFKMMKSFFNLRKIEHNNKQRALLSIYASLISVGLLTMMLTGIAQQMANAELSLYKAGKIFIKHLRTFLNDIRLDARKAVSVLRNKLCKYAKKESRVNRLSTRQIITSISV